MSTLVGKKAPHFSVKAVIKGFIKENISLSDYLGNYIVLFFYPLDFTFVCPTELHAFQERLMDFRTRGVEVIGCSVDSCFSHLAWLQQSRMEGGIAGVQYPLLSDINKTISRDYGVLCEEEGIAYRALFLIDRSGIIRHQLVNDLPLGRSVEETLRIVDALIFHEKHGEVCPANWAQGESAIQATQEGIKRYFALHDSDRMYIHTKS